MDIDAKCKCGHTYGDHYSRSNTCSRTACDCKGWVPYAQPAAGVRSRFGPINEYGQLNLRDKASPPDLYYKYSKKDWLGDKEEGGDDGE